MKFAPWHHLWCNRNGYTGDRVRIQSETLCWPLDDNCKVLYLSRHRMALAYDPGTSCVIIAMDTGYQVRISKECVGLWIMTLPMLSQSPQNGTCVRSGPRTITYNPVADNSIARVEKISLPQRLGFKSDATSNL